MRGPRACGRARETGCKGGMHGGYASAPLAHALQAPQLAARGRPRGAAARALPACARPPHLAALALALPRCCRFVRRREALQHRFERLIGVLVGAH
jgi:hypothetical protein